MEENPKKEKRFYTKAELEEFRLLILDKMEKSRIVADELSESLKEISGNSMDNNNAGEYGGESADKEDIENHLARQKKFLDNLGKALIRIENGTYGICKVTGKLIPKERLRIVPHTTTTVEAKDNQSRKE
jgi:RNA polymerase-binding transcription factor DksA